MNFLKKIDIYYFITLLFLILTANASFISTNRLLYLGVIIYLVLLGLSKRLLTTKDITSFIPFSVVYAVYVFARDFLVNRLDFDYILTDVVFFFKAGFLSFIFCKILKEKTAYYLVKVISDLTVLSFVFFFIQLLIPDLLYKLFISLSPPTGQEYVDGYSNLIVFTFTQGLHSYQNSGFVWEPGSFGCFLILALLLNLFLNNFKIDNKSKIFTFAIITTFSTTTYLALLITLFLVYRYRVKKINLGVVALLCLAISMIIFVPFMADKVTDVYYQDVDKLSKLNVLDSYYRHHTTAPIPLNRFGSMQYIFDNYTYKLILGVTIDYIKVARIPYNVGISNGVFDFLARFGLAGLTFLFYNYAKFCFNYAPKKEYIFYCILILFIIGFGEPVLILPIALMFLFIDKNSQTIVVTGKAT